MNKTHHLLLFMGMFVLLCSIVLLRGDIDTIIMHFGDAGPNEEIIELDNGWKGDYTGIVP